MDTLECTPLLLRLNEHKIYLEKFIKIQSCDLTLFVCVIMWNALPQEIKCSIMYWLLQSYMQSNMNPFS